MLARIRNDEQDPTAWREFVDRYGRRIFEWCRNRKLQSTDAEDVTQEVLLRLAKRLSTFEYDQQQTFRGWLRRITENAVTDFFRHRRAHGGIPVGIEALDQAEARADLVHRLSEAYDLELFDIAKSRVRARVAKQRWRAWELMAVEGLAGEVVAEQLDMKLPTVYSSRYQVQKMISDEVRSLERMSGNDRES